MNPTQRHIDFCKRYQNSIRRFVKFRPDNFWEENQNLMVYVCPICFSNCIQYQSPEFGITDEFDFDHYPPKSVGGQKVGLSCKSCNNTFGGKFESELKKELQYRSFNKGHANSKIPLKAKIKDVRGGPYKTNFEINEDGQHVFDLGLLPEIPEVLKWIEEIKNDSQKYNVNCQGVFPIYSKVKKSLIKAAYWYCFSRWGYQFSLSIGGNVMRKYILDKGDYPIELPFLYLLEEKFEQIPDGIAFINDSKHATALVAHIPMHLKETGYKCVVGVPIPNPTANCWEDIKKLFIDNFNKSINYTQIDLPILEQVRNYEDDWRQILEGNVEKYSPDSPK